MTEHPLYLGLDLSPEYTQLSYYKLDEGVPESICHSDSKDTYLLPNIMFYTDKYKDGTGAKDESGWSVGAVAAGKRFKEDGVVIVLKLCSMITLLSGYEQSGHHLRRLFVP